MHFGVGRASFYLFYLSIFIYFYLFPLIFIDFLEFFDFSRIFYIPIVFSRVVWEKIAPPLPKHVGFKNANRTRKLENRTVSFFLVNEFRIDLSIPVIKIFTILWRKKSHFLDFWLVGHHHVRVEISADRPEIGRIMLPIPPDTSKLFPKKKVTICSYSFGRNPKIRVFGPGAQNRLFW